MESCGAAEAAPFQNKPETENEAEAGFFRGPLADWNDLFGQVPAAEGELGGACGGFCGVFDFDLAGFAREQRDVVVGVIGGKNS